MIDIFTVKPIKYKNQVKIKYLGKNEEICDLPIECNENENNEEKYIINIDEEIYTRFYKCNMTDKFIMTNKILPIMYCSIAYQTNITGGPLLDIIIEFEITDEIKNEKELINNSLDGIFRMKIVKNLSNSEEIITDLPKFTTTKDTIKIISDLVKTEDMYCVLKDIINKKKKERIEKYGYFNNLTINKPTYKFNDLIKQYKMNKTLEL